MWLFKVFGVVYLTAVCGAQDGSDATRLPTVPPQTTALPKVTTPVYVPPVPSLQQVSTWSDVFPSEKVEFRCTVSDSSDWTFTWYRSGNKIDSDPSLSFSGDGSVLTITSATGGIYSCKGQHKTNGVMTQSSNSLQLNVYGNKPKPKLSQSSNYPEMFPGESITFTCTVDVSTGWEYLWYHNGQEIPAADGKTYPITSLDHSKSGQYQCKAKRGKDPFYTEASETTTLRVADPPTPTLKLVSPWLDVFENEMVEFSCEVSSSDWTSTWYRNQENLENTDIEFNMDEEGSTLNVTSITKAAQGDYTCKAHLTSRGVNSGFSNSVKVSVYDNVPTPTLSKDGFNSMYVGETVNFTCKVTVSSGWTYQWYKDEKALTHTSPTVSIFLGLPDEGMYSCKATRGETETKFSEKKQQDVLEIPVPSLELKTKWSDVFPTEAAELRCGMQKGSGWTYTWYKDKVEVQADNSVSFDSERATLSINSASPGKHEGQYECKGHLRDRAVSSKSSSPVSLTVYDKKPAVVLTQDPEYEVMFPGESVTFSCHINVSTGWEYLWYNDSVPIGVSENKYSVNSIGPTSRGSYTCQAKRGTNSPFTTDSSNGIRLEVDEKKPKPLMTQQPAADKLYTGESVSFECKVGISSGWSYYWFKDGALLPYSSNDFQIVNANSLDNGTYECKAVRDKTMFNTELSDGRILSISEIPVPSLKPVTQWLDVFPEEGVELSCGMPESSEWTYTWYKDTKEVQADEKPHFGKDKATLTFKSASTSHRGKYRCSGKLKSRSVNSNPSSEVTLHVYDTKPRVTLVQNLDHSLMHTGDPVSFSCHVDGSSGWEYLWYKDRSPLDISGVYHNISSVEKGGSGSYECKAKRGKKMVFNTGWSQAVKLDIKERPKASIILKTGWSEVFSTDSLVLECKVESEYKNWTFKWSKGRELINTSSSERHVATPHNDPEQSDYTCQGIRNRRPLYSRSSDSFTTRNLLLKRRMLLSISGCLFFGIIVVFLGCIVLRFTRKKAEVDENPEEANLFLTMAQLKECADAPCPLVEYITDADLDAPPKEGDENGTVCSETTPLPITSPEDKAVTSDNNDTTENGGGLVSFQQ
ncbi:titin-like [Stegastes partitus]|uniref:Titin-like n=1 Tax=Stegastes partitus TaxID=144197 RepID=A0A3B4ZGN2_9TELE|nr:PREDICTED: titin-like [Stegastes partitus]